MQLRSPNWHKVQSLRPYWRRGVTLRIDDNGTHAEYWLVSGSGQKSMRFNQSAWELIGRCHGEQSIDEIWNAITLDLEDHAPTQDETIALLIQTFASGLLECAQSENLQALEQHRETKATKDLQGQFSPTGFRWNWEAPHGLLNWLEHLSRPFTSKPVVVVAVLAILFALISWIQQGSRFENVVSQWIAQPHSALFIALVFFPLKAIHELAHATVALRFGIRVTQWGLSWILVFPAPYVDLSSAYALSQRYQRVLISAAGIITELSIAAVALTVWLGLDPHVQRNFFGQILLATWLTAGVSALLFNLNPLAKMDGYHIAVDLLNLPNLAQRSQLFWQKVFGIALALGQPRHRLSDKEVNDLVERTGERLWLMMYAPAALIWRATFFYWAFLWIGEMNRSLSYLVGVLALFNLVVMPIISFTKTILRGCANSSQRIQRLTLLSGIIGGLIAFITLVPLPDRAISQGQFWVTENEHAKAQSDGFISPRSFEDTQENPAQLVLLDPELATRIERTKTKIQALEQRLLAAQQTDLALFSVLESEKSNLEVVLANQERQLNELKASNPTNSAVRWIGPDDLPGQWVKKGQLLGLGAQSKPQSVRFFVDGDLANRLKSQNAQLFVGAPDVGALKVKEARLIRDRAGAINQLPSASLSRIYGGSITTDPTDLKHLKPLNPTFALDAQIDASFYNVVHGTRAWIVLDFGTASLASQVLRGLQSSVRSQFHAMPI